MFRIQWFHQSSPFFIKRPYFILYKEMAGVAFFNGDVCRSQGFWLSCNPLGLFEALNTSPCFVSSIVQFPTSLSCLDGKGREEPG